MRKATTKINYKKKITYGYAYLAKNRRFFKFLAPYKTTQMPGLHQTNAQMHQPNFKASFRCNKQFSLSNTITALKAFEKNILTVVRITID